MYVCVCVCACACVCVCVCMGKYASNHNKQPRVSSSRAHHHHRAEHLRSVSVLTAAAGKDSLSKKSSSLFKRRPRSSFIPLLVNAETEAAGQGAGQEMGQRAGHGVVNGTEEGLALPPVYERVVFKSGGCLVHGCFRVGSWVTGA